MRKLSIIKILGGDSTAGMAILVPVIMFGMFIAFEYFGLSLNRRGNEITAEDAGFFLNAGLITAALGIPYAIWRTRSIQQHFTNGTKVLGEIMSIKFRKGRGQIKYQYNYNGEQYERSNGVPMTQYTKGLKVGEQVDVIIDPEKPKKAFLDAVF